MVPPSNLHHSRASTTSPAPKPLDDTPPEFRHLAPWPTDLHFRASPTERIMQNLLPPRPDHPARTLTGSSAGLTADSEFAEGGGELAVERRAKDAERQRRKRAGARLSLG
jgi:hypothetical protein